MTEDHNKDMTVLVIDDESIIRQVFSYYLEDREYSVMTAENGILGMEVFDREKPDIVLTDLRMPQADGLEVLAHIREQAPETPVVVISGANSLDDAVQALRLGAWDYLIKPVQDLNLLGYTVKECLEKARLIKENRNYREHLEELVNDRTAQLEKRNSQLDLSRRQIIGILSQAAEYKDFETGNHFLRVSEMAACLAQGLGWDEDRVMNLQLASPVHDIGKIGIPDHILLKSGKLNEEEWHLMKEHCLFGQNILRSENFIKNYENERSIDISASSFLLMETAANIALSHHEFWNGEGYPMGIKGKAIPIEARITSVVDVYDALRSKRPYKEAWSEEKTLEYLKEKSGSQFDPEVVKVFFEKIEEIRLIQKKYREHL
jgi:putative two-component system response regulator